MKSLPLLVIASLLAVALPAQAQSAAELRQRMEQRIPSIDQLKLRGAVGENNQGLLEARGPGADAGLISSENADRSAVYALLARQTGASAADVGKARARKIAEHSPAGVWLQKDDGSWYRK